MVQKHKIKILIIAPLPPPYNGQSIATETLIKSKLKELFDFEIIDLKKMDSIGNSGRFTINRVIELLKCLFRYLISILYFNPDIIYLTISQSKLGFLRDIPFIWLSKVLDKKVIIHLHGGYFRSMYEDSQELYKTIIRKTLHKVDCAIVLTDSLKSIFEGIIPDNKIRVVYNCVAPEFLLSEEELNKKIMRLFSETFKVLYLSNLIPAKGYFDILRSALIIKKEGLPIEFIFAGAWTSNNEKEEVKNFIEEHNLNNVKFIGVVTGNAKREILLNSDIFVLPSKYEGLPISMLEAMGMGLPLIVTKIGGIPDVIEEGINGFFVPFNSPDDIAEKIKLLFYNKELTAKIIINNVEKVKKYFTVDKYEETFIKLFNELYQQDIKDLDMKER